MTKVPFTRIDIVATTAPTGVAVNIGTLWYDSVASKLKIFDGVVFQEYVELPDLVGSNITLVDNFAFTNETVLQDIMDDVNDNIFNPLNAEHDMGTGVHGPKVTITQSNLDSALDIDKTNASGGNVVNITNAGIGIGLNVNSTSIGGSGVLVTNSGSGDGLRIDQVGAGDAIVITGGTASIDAVDIDHSGTGSSLKISHTGSADVAIITGGTASANAINIDHSGASKSLLIMHAGLDQAVSILQTNTANSSEALAVTNSGSDSSLKIIQAATTSQATLDIETQGGSSARQDISGTGNTWNITKSGDASLKGIRTGSATTHVKIFSGTVTAAGTILHVGTGGWTVSRPALGTYSIVFTVPFSVVPSVIITEYTTSGEAGVASTDAVATNVVSVGIFNKAGDVRENRIFNFIAIGQV